MISASEAATSPARLIQYARQHNPPDSQWRPARHLEHINAAIMDAITGRASRKVLVSIAPRHGKSDLVSVALPAWWLGTFPDKPVILSSYGASVAGDFGAASKQIIDDVGNEVFGIGVDAKVAARDNWRIDQHRGFMRAVGAGGPLTGRGGSLMLCDDPIQNWEAYSSETTREGLKQWWSSTFMSRAEPDAVIVVASQRWGQDDLQSYLLEQDDDWRHIQLPALALENDPLGRKPGEALWPQMWPVAALEAKRKNQGSVWFEVQHQCDVTAHVEKTFSADWVTLIDAAPRPESCINIRAWDLAASAGRGDYSAGVLLRYYHQKQAAFICDVVRGRWSANEVKQVVRQTAERDGFNTLVRIEQEPGASGVGWYQSLAQALPPGTACEPIKPTKNKTLRAQPLAAAMEAGRVFIVGAKWNKPFIDELLKFPAGRNDDQIDAASMAYAAATQAAADNPWSDGKYTGLHIL